MRFNKAVAGALVAGAGLAHAQDEFCSERSTLVVTEYVTLPGPVASTPSPVASSSVDGSVPDETTQVQVVTIKPVPATSTPAPPMTTSTVYSTTSSVNTNGEVVYQTISQYTTVISQLCCSIANILTFPD